MDIETAIAMFGGKQTCPRKPDIVCYRKGIIPAGAFSGHGLLLVQRRFIVEIGMMDWEHSTLIGKSGGTFVNEGDFLVHDPTRCLDGIRRFYD